VRGPKYYWGGFREGKSQRQEGCASEESYGHDGWRTGRDSGHASHAKVLASNVNNSQQPSSAFDIFWFRPVHDPNSCVKHLGVRKVPLTFV
jgi:hypothetical protein